MFVLSFALSCFVFDHMRAPVLTRAKLGALCVVHCLGRERAVLVVVELVGVLVVGHRSCGARQHPAVRANPETRLPLPLAPQAVARAR